MHTAPLLIVSDDEPSIGVALRRHLSSRGVEVYIDVSSDVVALAAHFRPDAILLDLEQHRDGLALLEELQASEATREIPVFAMTDGMVPDADGQAPGEIAPGVVAVVSKPLPEAFVERLAGFLQTHHRDRPRSVFSQPIHLPRVDPMDAIEIVVEASVGEDPELDVDISVDVLIAA